MDSRPPFSADFPFTTKHHVRSLAQSTDKEGSLKIETRYTHQSKGQIVSLCSPKPLNPMGSLRSVYHTSQNFKVAVETFKYGA